MAFDPNAGYQTRELLLDYIGLLRRLDEIMTKLVDSVFERKHAALGIERESLTTLIREKKAKLEHQLAENRRTFPAMFHHLDEVSSRNVQAALSKYERDRREAGPYYDPPYTYKKEFEELAAPLSIHRRYLDDVIFELKQEIALREKYQTPAPPATMTEEGLRAEIEPLLRRGLTIEQVCDQLEQEYPEQRRLVNGLRRRLKDELQESL